MMRNIELCIVCGKHDFSLRYPSNYFEGEEAAPRYFLTHRKRAAHGDIRYCDSCGFTFTSPQFLPEQYDTIYGSIPPSPPGSDSEAATVRFRSLVRRLSAHSATGRLLDFGCGAGDFLKFADGFESYGFDVSAAPHRWDGRIFYGRLAEARTQREFSDNSFDVIVAWDVFEHLPEIESDVKSLNALLKPGGVLAFTIPNVTSLSARLQGRWWNSYLLEHLWYFNPETIDTFLSMRGFRKLELKSISYPASVGLLLSRLNQTFSLGLPSAFAPPSWVIPFPIGLLFGAYEKI